MRGSGPPAAHVMRLRQYEMFATSQTHGIGGKNFKKTAKKKPTFSINKLKTTSFDHNYYLFCVHQNTVVYETKGNHSLFVPVRVSPKPLLCNTYNTKTSVVLQHFIKNLSMTPCEPSHSSHGPFRGRPRCRKQEEWEHPQPLVSQFCVSHVSRL